MHQVTNLLRWIRGELVLTSRGEAVTARPSHRYGSCREMDVSASRKVARRTGRSKCAGECVFVGGDRRWRGFCSGTDGYALTVLATTSDSNLGRNFKPSRDAAFAVGAAAAPDVGSASRASRTSARSSGPDGCAVRCATKCLEARRVCRCAVHSAPRPKNRLKAKAAAERRRHRTARTTVKSFWKARGSSAKIEATT